MEGFHKWLQSREQYELLRFIQVQHPNLPLETWEPLSPFPDTSRPLLVDKYMHLETGSVYQFVWSTDILQQAITNLQKTKQDCQYFLFNN